MSPDLTTLRLVATHLAEPAALLVADPWRIDTANEPWNEVAGCDSEADHSVAWSALVRLCDLSASTRTGRHATVHAERADVRFEVTPVPDGTGEVGHVVVLARFIVGEEQLRTSDQERLDASPALIARFGPDLRVTAVNRTVVDLSGLQVQQIIGRTNLEMGYPEELARLWDDTYRGILASGRTAETVYDLPTVHGTVRYRTMAVPSFDAAGSVREVTVISMEEAKADESGGLLGDGRFVAQMEPTMENVAVARHDVIHHAASNGAESVTDAVELVVSELVANAVEHGSSAPVEVSAQRLTDVYLLEVRQGGNSTVLDDPDQWSMPGAAAGRGRGQAIVVALSSSVDTRTEGGVLSVRCLFSLTGATGRGTNPIEPS